MLDEFIIGPINLWSGMPVCSGTRQCSGIGSIEVGGSMTVTIRQCPPTPWQVEGNHLDDTVCQQSRQTAIYEHQGLLG